MPALFQSEKWPLSQLQGLFQANPTYVTTRKPIDAVLGRIALLLVMLAGAMIVLALPLSLFLAPWKAALGAIGVVLIYGGVSFFAKPQFDSDPAMETGEAFESPADRWRRLLLHLAFVPGRFAAETLLDACVLLGVAGGAEVGAADERQLADEPAVGETAPPDVQQYSQPSWERGKS